MKQHLIHLLTGCIFFSLLLAGCSNQQTTALKPQPNKPLPNSHHDTQDVHNKKTDAKQDGQVISMEKIKVSGINPQVTPYRMMYWSEGTKAEAYIAIPSSGRYPLYVSLHGGYLEPLKKSHVTEVGNVHYGKNIIEFARDNTITIAPMYRGYGHSDGTINGIYKNTIDTENAIKALMNYTKTHKDFPDIKKGHTYLHGVSMGGGVALRLAAERKNVLSVVAVSPFVGWDILGSWYEEHNPGRLYDVVGYFNK